MAKTLKWGLFGKVLPLTALFALAKLGVHGMGLEPWEFDSLTGSLFGASSFVIAFILSGTLSNYNASDEMVVQFANAIEAIADINLYAVKVHGGHHGEALNGRLANLLLQLSDWLSNKIQLDQLLNNLAELNLSLAELRLATADSVADRALPELAKMRFLVHKMAASRDNEFLGPAYALLEIFLIGTVMALLLIGADRFSENLVVSCFLFTSFTYLLILIRDLDNPFQYDGSSCIDVDLSCLGEVRERLVALVSHASTTGIRTAAARSPASPTA
jgi:hypothetical protein